MAEVPCPANVAPQGAEALESVGALDFLTCEVKKPWHFEANPEIHLLEQATTPIACHS